MTNGLVSKDEIKRIVAYQFDHVTNLTPEAYEDSLKIIADQIQELLEVKE